MKDPIKDDIEQDVGGINRQGWGGDIRREARGGLKLEGWGGTR